jgi:hypothetical protein
MNANDLTFGIEIETTMPIGSTPVGGHGCGVQVPWLPQGWLADRDPSIQVDAAGRMACEFVSPVLKGAAGLKQLLGAVAEIKAHGGKVNASCGIHVHVGFDRNDTVTLEKLVTLVANHEKAIFASTGTKSRETGRWCHSVKRYGNAESARQGAGNQRYHVLNLTNITTGRKPTVEFRAFSSSLNTIKIVGYIRMCIGLVELAHNTKRVTKWNAKTPVETSPIHRGGEGATEINRLFYKLGWTKGRTNYVAGNVTCDGAATVEQVKNKFNELAKKYDAAQ